jgi:hypothetical protein
MIYDTPITIMQLPDNVGTIIQGKPTPVFDAYCGELTVYHTRFWESVQAGSRIEAMVELPLRRNVRAGMYAKYKDHLYLISQAQFERDKFQLPITILSLSNPENAYDT